MFTRIVALAALAANSVVAPSPHSPHVLHERRDLETSWVKRDALEEDFTLPMRIGLTQNNLDKGHDWLLEVSDPDSPKYGKHYTAEEVHDLFAPSDSTAATVRAWLEAAGIKSDKITQSFNKQWIQFDVPANHVENVFKTKYHYYEHSESGKMGVGCDEYHVPKEIQGHIDYITPGVKLVATQTHSSRAVEKRKLQNLARGRVSPVPPGDANYDPNDLSKCSGHVSPQCVRAMYNFTQATLAQPGNELGIYETGDDAAYLSPLDLNSFFTLFDQRIPNNTFPIVEGVDGAKNIKNEGVAGVEAAIDFQISYPIIYPQKSILFITDDVYYESLSYPKKGILNNFLDAIDGSYCNYSAYGISGNSPQDPSYPDPHKGGYKGQLQCGKYNATNVISISYDTPEIGYGLPANYYQRQCSEYMKLGLQGVSVVVASGDYGVGTTDPGLSSPACLGPKNNVFSALFPASCPYVTSVGATYLPPGASAGMDEEAATKSFPSGGGFSNIFPRPAYQEAAVTKFFDSPHAPTYPYYSGHTYGGGLYNRTGRGFPDVSAAGDFIDLYLAMQRQLGSGTSVSAPLFASILTRINDERLKAGKSTVGFVNPTLYKNPQALHDITEGTNPNCNVTGFKAGPGWDPLTGLGTPNYPALLDVFMKI